jgi:hypothetical protein
MAFYEPTREPVELTAQFDFDRPLLERALLDYYRTMPGVRSARVMILVMAVFAFLVFGRMVPSPVGWIGGGVILVVFFWLAARMPRNYLRNALRNLAVDENPVYLGSRRVEVTRGSLAIVSDLGRSEWKLGSIYRLKRVGRQVLMHPIPGLTLPIPDTADFGRETFDTFAEKLETLYSLAGGTGNR